MKVKLLAMAVSVLTLIGCKSTPSIDANLTASISSNAPINQDTKLGVFAARSAKDNGTSEYIDKIVEQLKNKGYETVYSSNQLALSPQAIDVAVFVNLDAKSTVQTVLRSEKVLTPSSESACSSSSSDSNGTKMVSCTRKSSEKVVTRHVPQTIEMRGLFFATTWVDVLSKEELAYTLTSTFDKSCNDDNTFIALITESIISLDLIKGKSSSKRVTIPQDTSCKS